MKFTKLLLSTVAILVLATSISHAQVQGYTAPVDVFFSFTERTGTYTATFDVDINTLTGVGGRARTV